MVKAPHESHRLSRPFNVTRDSCYPAPHPSKKHILPMHMHMYLLGTRTLNRGEEIGKLASSTRFSIVTAISWSFEQSQHEREHKISEAQISEAHDILETSSIQSMGGTRPTLPTSGDSALNHAVYPRERDSLYKLAPIRHKFLFPLILLLCPSRVFVMRFVLWTVQ